MSWGSGCRGDTNSPADPKPRALLTTTLVKGIDWRVVGRHEIAGGMGGARPIPRAPQPPRRARRRTRRTRTPFKLRVVRPEPAGVLDTAVEEGRVSVYEGGGRSGKSYRIVPRKSTPWWKRLL